MDTTRSILSLFPNIPSAGKFTIAEHHGQLLHSDIGETGRTINSPVVSLSAESTRSSSTVESAKSAFLSLQYTTWKKILMAWFEQGLLGAVEELNTGRQDRDVGVRLLRVLMTGVLWMKSAYYYVFPGLNLNDEQLAALTSTTRNWVSGTTRALAWHPQANKLAVALTDNSIKVYTFKNDLVPILKHKLQKNVADIEWQPHSSSTLAVACQLGIIIWSLEPTSLALRPSTNCARVLQADGHCPVSSISWKPSGPLLLSCCPRDASLIIWNVAMENYVPLRRLGGGGLTVGKWSPDGNKVFCATVSTIFRVWETRTWTCEKWSNLSSRCQAFCWSPDGTVVLFSTENEPLIYSLTFAPGSNGGGSTSAIVCANVSETYVTREDGEKFRVGGKILSLTWNQTAERLAVCFTGNSSDGSSLNHAVIALFHTKLQPYLELLPCGFVVGRENDVVEHVSFQPRYYDGALLCVMWSDGRLSYVPLSFASAMTSDFHSHSHLAQLNLPQTGSLHSLSMQKPDDPVATITALSSDDSF